MATAIMDGVKMPKIHKEPKEELPYGSSWVKCPKCGAWCIADWAGSFECNLCDYYDEGDWI